MNVTYVTLIGFFFLTKYGIVYLDSFIDIVLLNRVELVKYQSLIHLEEAQHSNEILLIAFNESDYRVCSGDFRMYLPEHFQNQSY